jgi:hypothetical protein
LHLGKEAFDAGDYSLGKAPHDTRETLDRTYSYKGNLPLLKSAYSSK